MKGFDFTGCKVMEKYAILVRLALASPLSVTPPLVSQASDTYPLPPPTSLVGALAYPYLRGKIKSEIIVKKRESYSPALELLDKVLYAAAGVPKSYVLWKSVERTVQIPYVKPSNWRKNPEQRFGVALRGEILTDEILVLYIVREQELAKYAWGITRIGRKEGVVVVKDVVVQPLEKAIVDEKRVKTWFYFPEGLAKDRPDGSYIVVDMPVLHPHNFSQAKSFGEIVTKRFYVPDQLVSEPLTVKLSDQATTVSLAGFYIPVPKDVVR